MIDPLISVTSVTPLPDFKLRLVFSDGAQGVFDCKPHLWGDAFVPVKSPAFFRRVAIDHGVPTWPNGADFDAAVLRQDIEAPPPGSRLPKIKTPHAAKTAAVAEDPAPYGVSARSAPRPARTGKRS